MITVHCRTNLDDYKHEEWPKRFCCPPRKGDFVMSKSGKSLKIHEITHRQILVPGDNRYKPILIIELNN